MRRWLGWFAPAVIIGMQADTVFTPLGTVGETRVADWVDLLTPYAILSHVAADGSVFPQFSELGWI
jgi:hypothetical protein